MTATDELRALLDERGVEHSDFASAFRSSTRWQDSSGRVIEHQLRKDADIWDMGIVRNLTPAQAIDATLGRGTCRKVYLVETSDDLLESWYPIAVYLHRESAEDCAEALRKEEDGIRQFARVSELRVVDG